VNIAGKPKGFSARAPLTLPPPSPQPDAASQTQSHGRCERNRSSAVSRHTGSERRTSLRRLASVEQRWATRSHCCVCGSSAFWPNMREVGVRAGSSHRAGRNRGLLTGPELSTGSEAAASTPVARTRTAARRRAARCGMRALPNPLQHAQHAAQHRWNGKRPRACGKAKRCSIGRALCRC